MMADDAQTAALQDVVLELRKLSIQLLGAYSSVRISPSYKGGYDVEVSVYSGRGETVTDAGDAALAEFLRLRDELARRLAEVPLAELDGVAQSGGR
jgi:hypothetical protein